MPRSSYRTNEVNQARLEQLAQDLQTTPNALINEGLKCIFERHNVPWSEMPSGRPAMIELNTYARKLFGADKAKVSQSDIMITCPDVLEIARRTSRWWTRIDGRPTAESKLHGAEAIENDDGETIGYWLPISD